MYAIAFDLDTEVLMSSYGSESWQNAYADIKKRLLKLGFEWKQDSVYFGKPNKINAVTCVLAAIDLAQAFPWFSLSVRDIRMLRIEEENDLMSAVQQASSEEALH